MTAKKTTATPRPTPPTRPTPTKNEKAETHPPTPRAEEGRKP